MLDPDRSLFQGRHFSTCYTPDLGRNTKVIQCCHSACVGFPGLEGLPAPQSVRVSPVEVSSRFSVYACWLVYVLRRETRWVSCGIPVCSAYRSLGTPGSLGITLGLLRGQGGNHLGVGDGHLVRRFAGMSRSHWSASFRTG